MGIRRFCVAGVLLSLLCAPGLALAQPAPAAPPLKTIGKPSSGRPELIQSLIVMNARGATLEGDKLTLIGIAPNSIIFADRPVRLAGHELTTLLLEDWGKGNDNFTKDPPNATVSVFSKDGMTVKDAVVVLKAPKFEGENLSYTVQVLEGDLRGADGPAALFIDIFGIWRRAAFRGAIYAGAVTSAATAGAAAASANEAAATASAYNAGVAAGEATAYVVGMDYATLPPGCVKPVVGGATYYLCGSTWFQPVFGANGAYYRAVPAP